LPQTTLQQLSADWEITHTYYSNVVKGNHMYVGIAKDKSQGNDQKSAAQPDGCPALFCF
jgi:hypothetical protein